MVNKSELKHVNLTGKPTYYALDPGELHAILDALIAKNRAMLTGAVLDEDWRAVISTEARLDSYRGLLFVLFNEDPPKQKTLDFLLKDRD